MNINDDSWCGRFYHYFFLLSFLPFFLNSFIFGWIWHTHICIYISYIFCVCVYHFVCVYIILCACLFLLTLNSFGWIDKSTGNESFLAIAANHPVPVRIFAVQDGHELTALHAHIVLITSYKCVKNYVSSRRILDRTKWWFEEDKVISHDHQFSRQAMITFHGRHLIIYRKKYLEKWMDIRMWELWIETLRWTGLNMSSRLLWLLQH